MDTVRPKCIKTPNPLSDDATEISLNGGVVSNKGFIAQFASPGTSIIPGPYVSAWGGIQSAGQTVGQIVSFVELEPFVNDLPTTFPALAICHGGLWA